MNGNAGWRVVLIVGMALAGLLEAALIAFIVPQRQWKLVLVIGVCSGIASAALAWALSRGHRWGAGALEARVELLQGEVAAAHQRLHDSLSGAAHNLSQPLTTLHCTLELALLSSATGADQRPSLEDALQHSQSAMTITRLLAQMADVEAGSRPTGPTPLGPLLSDLRNDLDLAAEARGARLVWDSESSVVATANPADLRRAILYLAEHALDRNTQGGPVEVTLEQDESAARILISDQGPPIPAEDLPHWFEPFYCGSSVSTKNRGSVRLAIAERSISSCGGSVTAINKGRLGVRFLVLLPLARIGNYPFTSSEIKET